MDWQALAVSAKLAGVTALILVPLGIVVGRWLAFNQFRGRALVEALVALPLLLPPTVLGFYMLQGMSANSPFGQWVQALTGQGVAFTFQGLVVASIIANLPFAIQPLQRAFEAIGTDVRHAAWVGGLSPWQTFLRIELPLAWPGLLTSIVLTIAHTMGEFGVVLMVGGSIPGETRTFAIAIYDRVQAFDMASAGLMAATLLAISFVAIALVYGLGSRSVRVSG
jgi:molybdate transport system permease protein